MKRILVTGSNGRLGREATTALRTLDTVEVIGLDRRGDPDLRVDLADPDEDLIGCLTGVDIVVHLAGEPSPFASVESVVRDNIDASLRLLGAAETVEIKRVVFASSNWVLGGHRFASTRLTPGTSPFPVNPYGWSKLVIERAGSAMAERSGITFLALRIGYCLPEERPPGTTMGFGRWGQRMWLSSGDWARIVQLACIAPCAGAHILNAMSNNVGSRWELDETARVLGYVPGDGHRPVLTLGLRFRELAARLRDRMTTPGAPAPLFGRRW